MSLQKLKKDGFVYLNFNKDIKNYVHEINKLIEPYFKKINSDKLKKENYSKLIFEIQSKINKTFPPEFFF